MDNPLISVIIPVYKVENYLKQCLDSVCGQTYNNLEIILVDDGSPDDCGEICDEYAMKDSRVKVIHKKNGGLSSARNTALDIAMGDYISFVDSDDYLDLLFYEKLMTTALANDSQIVMCGRYDVSQTGICPKFFLDKNCTITKKEVMGLILADKIGSQPWDKLYKKSLFENIRFPEGRVYEDIGTTYLAFHKCNNFAFMHEPLYYYRLNNAGISYSERPNKIFDTFKSFFERLIFTQENYPAYVSECLALAFGTAMGSLNYYIRFKFEEEKANLSIVKKFLSDYKDKIYSNELISTPRKLSLKLLLFSEPLYNAIMKFAIKVKYSKR